MAKRVASADSDSDELSKAAKTRAASSEDAAAKDATPAAPPAATAEAASAASPVAAEGAASVAALAASGETTPVASPAPSSEGTADPRRKTLYGNTVDAPPVLGAVKAPPELSQQEIIDLCSTYPVEVLPTRRKPLYSALAKRQVYQHVAVTNRIAYRTAVVGVHQLLRKGATNSGSPASLSSDIYCPDTKRQIVLTKGELSLSIRKSDGYTKDDKNEVRTFGESVAVESGAIATAQLKANPNLPLDVLAGDLFGKISRVLAAAGQPKLTPLEAIWCSSYCQNVPNLNALANSERLEQLLAKDLEQRLEANKKKVAGAGIKGNKRGQGSQRAKEKAATKPKTGPYAKGAYATENKNPPSN